MPDKGLYTYDTYDRIKDNPDIDVVYIVLPNCMHAEYTIRAHKAGKHVLCEKPMANTVKDCETMIAAAKAASKKLVVGYRLRYEPYTQAMIKMVRERGVRASPRSSVRGRLQHRRPGPVAPEQAARRRRIDDGHRHLRRQRRALPVGEEPDEVYGMEYSTPNDPRFKEVEETINFQIRFPSGVLANCVSSYGIGLNRFRVHAEKGSSRWSRPTAAAPSACASSAATRSSSAAMREPDHFAA